MRPEWRPRRQEVLCSRLQARGMPNRLPLRHGGTDHSSPGATTLSGYKKYGDVGGWDSRERRNWHARSVFLFVDGLLCGSRLQSIALQTVCHHVKVFFTQLQRPKDGWLTSKLHEAQRLIYLSTTTAHVFCEACFLGQPCLLCHGTH